MFEELFKMVGKLAAAVDRVLHDGLTEHVEARFSVMGRRIGIKAEVSILDQAPKVTTPSV